MAPSYRDIVPNLSHAPFSPPVRDLETASVASASHSDTHSLCNRVREASLHAQAPLSPSADVSAIEEGLKEARDANKAFAQRRNRAKHDPPRFSLEDSEAGNRDAGEGIRWRAGSGSDRGGYDTQSDIASLHYQSDIASTVASTEVQPPESVASMSPGAQSLASSAP